MLAGLAFRGDLSLKVGSHTRRARVYLECLARLRIDKSCETDVRELALTGIFHGHRNDVVSLRENLQWALYIRRIEVRYQEDDRLLRKRAREVVRHAGDVGSAPDRLEGQDVTEYAKDMLASFPWGKNVLDPVSEQHDAHPVVVSHRRHREYRRELSRELALESPHRSEALRAGEIDSDHHCQLALFDVALHERAAHSRGHVPVDRANLVSGLILAYLGELHSLTLERAAVFAGEQRVDEAARAKLDELHLAKNLGGNAFPYCFAAGIARLRRSLSLALAFRSAKERPSQLLRFLLAARDGVAAAPPAERSAAADHGAATVARMRDTIASLVTSSASASYVVRTR